MHRRFSFAVGGAFTCLAFAPMAMAAPPAHVAKSVRVTVRVQGATKALLAPKPVKTGSGSITKAGAPAGACPSSSAAGALNVATHGRWGATWYSSFNDYLINSILGSKASGNFYWGIWVNNRYATTGACEIKLRAGDQLLFAVDSVKQHEHPLGISTVSTAAGSFTVKVVAYSDAGKATPLAGARVTGRGVSATTNRSGLATITVAVGHRASVTAGKRSYIRTAPLTLGAAS